MEENIRNKEKINKEIETLKNNQTEILKMKDMANKINHNRHYL